MKWQGDAKIHVEIQGTQNSWTILKKNQFQNLIQSYCNQDSVWCLQTDI